MIGSQERKEAKERVARSQQLLNKKLDRNWIGGIEDNVMIVFSGSTIRPEPKKSSFGRPHKSLNKMSWIFAGQ